MYALWRARKDVNISLVVGWNPSSVGQTLDDRNTSLRRGISASFIPASRTRATFSSLRYSLAKSSRRYPSRRALLMTLAAVFFGIPPVPKPIKAKSKIY